MGDDSLFAAATPARWGASRSPCRGADAGPSLRRRSAALPYGAAPALRRTVWDAQTLGVPRRRPVLVVFGFPLSERAALLRMLHRDYDVAPDTVAPAARPCAYVVVRPATQQIALTLATLHGTHHRAAADGCEYYLGVLERPDLNASFVPSAPTAAPAASAVAAPKRAWPAGLWARWARWWGGGGGADAGRSAYRRVERQSTAHMVDALVRALGEIFGSKRV